MSYISSCFIALNANTEFKISKCVLCLLKCWFTTLTFLLHCISSRMLYPCWTDTNKTNKKPCQLRGKAHKNMCQTELLFLTCQFWCLGDSSCAFLYLHKVVSFIVIKWHSIETILIKANSIFLFLLFSLECKYWANNLNRPMSMVFCNVLLAAC